MHWVLAASAQAPDTSTKELEALLGLPVYSLSRVESAGKQKQDIRAAPGAVLVRTGGEIRSHGYRTLGEVLEMMPGVQLRYDRAYSYASVRGTTRPGDYTSRLLVLVDGARVNDALYDSAPLDREFPIDIALIDRIEFTPGPGSALYGTNAVAGVLNVITLNAAQVGGGSLMAEVGSLRSRRQTAIWGGAAGDTRIVFGASRERRPGGDLYFPEYDAPQTQGGVAQRQDGERSDKVFVKLNQGGLRVSASWSERIKDIPTGAYDATFNRPNPWKDGYALADLAYSSETSGGHAYTTQLAVGRYTFYSLGDHNYGEDGASVPFELRNDARWASGGLLYHWTGWQRHRVSLGVDAQRNFRQSIDTAFPEALEQSEISGSATRYGVFVNDQWQPVPTLTLTTGLRLDRRSTSRGDSGQDVSPRVAVVWTPESAWTFKLLYGQAFRQPNFYETDYSDSVQPRPENLKGERARSFELVTLWQPNGSLSFTGSAYRILMKDVIELMDIDDDRVMYVNRGRTTSTGAELEATWLSLTGVRLRASMAFQRAEDGTTGARLSNVSSYLAKWSLTVPGVLPDTRLGVNSVTMGPRTTVSGARLPAVTVVNAHLTWQPTGGRWYGAMGAYNLASKRYADPAGPEHRQDTLQQNGRQWRVQVGRSF